MTANQSALSTVHRHRVVVIGGGFGGLRVARGLRGVDADVTIVDAHNFHTFQPLLYQVATAGLDPDDVAHPLRGLFRGHDHIDVRVARVDDIDLDERIVRVSRGEPLPYDTLVIAAGTISADLGIDGVEEHTFALKSVADATRIRDHILAVFEAADIDADFDRRQLDVAICGGGPTGVEMAGGLKDLYEHVLRKDFPDLPVSEARITVIEALDHLLDGFSDQSSTTAHATLEERDVRVMVGSPVERVERCCVHVQGGERVHAGTIVWATGVKAAPLAERLGVELGKGGRIVVDHDLSVPGHPEVFAIGDIAVDPDHPLPQIAQPAIQGGRHVAEQIGRRLRGEPTEPFDYVDKGTMATIGRRAAVADLPIGLHLKGTIGWLAWLGLHLVYLIGKRNRLSVLVDWAWNYLTYDRASRLLSPTTDGLPPTDDEEIAIEAGMTG